MTHSGISFWNPASLISTWFGVGFIRPAPGTWGTLAAIPFGWAITHFAGTSALAFASIAAYAVGIWSSDYYSRATNSHDASEIVIDEVAGIWLALAFAPVTLIGFALSFILFRAFDIMKPWPIGWLDKNLPGGVGIMSDDMLAGLIAGIIVYFLNQVGWLPNVFS